MRRALTFACLVSFAASCTFGERDVPLGQDKPVVHAVLNPTMIEQSILVERTLTGRITVIEDSASIAADPIVSGGGIPISGARVTVTGPDGATATAIETQVVRQGRTTPSGTGVYQFLNTSPTAGQGAPRPGGFGASNQILVAPGQRYTLRVELPDGRVTTGETRVPGTSSTKTDIDFAALTFSRDVDTLRLRWPAVPSARTYALRVENPYGAFFLFTDSTEVALTGELRNLFVDRLPRVFQTGFTQNVYIAAVDTNYFDYYRSTNSPFTGSGIINRLSGGIGFFGAYVPIMTRALFVRAAEHDPVDGRYIANTVSGQETLRLWVEARGNGVAEMTGAYRLPAQDQYGVLGTLQGDQLHLRAVDNRDSRFIVRTIDGTLRGDTIFAKVAGQMATNDPGDRIFVRQRSTP